MLSRSLPEEWAGTPFLPFAQLLFNKALTSAAAQPSAAFRSGRGRGMEWASLARPESERAPFW